MWECRIPIYSKYRTDQELYACTLKAPGSFYWWGNPHFSDHSVLEPVEKAKAEVTPSAFA
jgi:hypothetical protein